MSMRGVLHVLSVLIVVQGMPHLKRLKPANDLERVHHHERETRLSSNNISVPHLTGIFVSLDSTTANRTVEAWVLDLQAMKNVGIEWFCIRAVLAGSSHPAVSTACPFGGLISYFPNHTVSQCITGPQPGLDPVGNILEAAKQVGLGVHLGLAFPETSRRPPWMNSTEYYREFAGLCWATAQQVWTQYRAVYGGVIQGWYTGIEESNNLGELDLTLDLTGHYLQPLARDLRNLTSPQPTLIWASPYYVGNLTRDPETNYMTPRFYADWWEQVFHLVPDLDFIAPQDSMGAQGNSFENVTSFLTELAQASARAGRTILSNVELFEVWPQGCQWTPKTGACHGRHPAPFERIKGQMQNEQPVVRELIAWEWHTCLSPFGSTGNTTILYQQYYNYVHEIL